jgi:hypothetical protein
LSAWKNHKQFRTTPYLTVKEKSVSKDEQQKQSTLVSTETFENLTNKQLQDESAKIDAEMKALDLELKRAEVSKLRAQINQKRDDARTRNLAIQNFMKQREMQQEGCNHLKGGTGADAFMRGTGDSPYYAIIKHKLPSNLYMVLCQRCGKEWHPADKFDKSIKETPGYQQALAWPTNNSASGSSTFLFERVAV